MPDIMPGELAQIIATHKALFGGFVMQADEAGGHEGGSPSGETPAADDFKAITTQDELNRIVGERIARERSKFADYGDLKAKAAQFDKIEEQNKTEIQRATERAEAAEAERTEAARLLSVYRIAGQFDISTKPDADGSPSDAELFLTATTEEGLIAQAQRFQQRIAAQQQQGVDFRISNSGRQAEPPADKDAQARSFFGI